MENRDSKPKKNLKKNISGPMVLRTKGISFPIVGIGASAGGLEALGQFFSNLPLNTGMAFVVIQHLDPTHKSIMPKLLQRVTSLKVIIVTDRLKIKPECVYVIPPNTSMSILKGALHLFEPVEVRGLRLPIDFFFSSLADDSSEKSIGIILSGMGSDGTSGLRSIKEKGGIALVQDPNSAKFDGMPRSAIENVLVDIIAPANELGGKLIDFHNHPPVISSGDSFDLKDKSSLEKIIMLLRKYTGNDFSQYKKNTIYRRIERRMAVHTIAKINDYVRFLQKNASEGEILFKELLIGVTSFFRDPDVWDKLKDSVLPDLIARAPLGYSIRAWVPGCSTGEEAYSLAIIFKEILDRFKTDRKISLQIFATDLDSDSIAIARKGIFPEQIAANISPDRLGRFFAHKQNSYRINAGLREMVVFAPHNVINDPPFTRMDIITCRNLLIYFEPEIQKKLLTMFQYSLNPEGILILGNAETLGFQNHSFNTIDAKLRLFRKYITEETVEGKNFPSFFQLTNAIENEKTITMKGPENIQFFADKFLLQHFSPSSVLVNDKGDIIYITGHTGNYLEPAAGKANLNIFAMARKGLQNELPGAFRRVIQKKETVVLKNLTIGTNGGYKSIDVTIQKIDMPEALKGMIMVIFTEAKSAVAIKRTNTKSVITPEFNNKSDLETELEHTREELLIANEEAQASKELLTSANEELQSANEELQSTNEELQSTNEELLTSKEELQSLNEELQTVNAELQNNIEDFTSVNNDLKNLLDSLDIATLLVDKKLIIRRFTKQATTVFKLKEGDVGRPFTGLASNLDYKEMEGDALNVLQTLILIEKTIPAKDGRWFKVRILPYRTVDDRIDGLVITLSDITIAKKLEAELNSTIEKLNAHNI